MRPSRGYHNPGVKPCRYPRPISTLLRGLDPRIHDFVRQGLSGQSCAIRGEEEKGTPFRTALPYRRLLALSVMRRGRYRAIEAILGSAGRSLFSAAGFARKKSRECEAVHI